MPIPQKKILVVDDEPSVCEAIKLMLVCQGHQVVTAHSGKEALVVFDPRKFDLVTTDYEMEGMRGDELAATIKGRAPGTPVIMISAHAGMLQFSNHDLDGLDYILGKPFSYQALSQAIAHVSQPTVGAGRA